MTKPGMQEQKAQDKFNQVRVPYLDSWFPVKKLLGFVRFDEAVQEIFTIEVLAPITCGIQDSPAERR